MTKACFPPDPSGVKAGSLGSATLVAIPQVAGHANRPRQGVAESCNPTPTFRAPLTRKPNPPLA